MVFCLLQTKTPDYTEAHTHTHTHRNKLDAERDRERGKNFMGPGWSEFLSIF